MREDKNYLLAPSEDEVINNEFQFELVTSPYQKVPDINDETGLIDYYSGPLTVIDSSAIDSIDPSLIAAQLYVNNYYLKLNDKEMNEVMNIRSKLHLQTNTSGLYNVSEISQQFVFVQKQQFTTNMVRLTAELLLITINIILYISFRTELKEKEFVIRYYSGSSLASIYLSEIWTIMLACAPLSILFFNKYSLCYKDGYSYENEAM